jgi:hypothetical protein
LVERVLLPPEDVIGSRFHTPSWRTGGETSGMSSSKLAV